jgi:hypothetical protein
MEMHIVTEVVFGLMQLALDVQTFNEVYGPTCNPYNPELSAGGSSGGCHENPAIS